MALISYVLMTTNKWLLISESHDDLNRYTPCRGNLTQTTRTLPTLVNVRHSYASCGQSPYVATFHANTTELDRFNTLENKELLTTSPAHRLTDLWVPI
jgi:hypothetical protein